MKTVTVRYFASLRESAGKGEETYATDARSVLELYQDLAAQYGFELTSTHVKASRNREIVDMSESFSSGDEIVFLPPVAGG